MDDIAQFDFPTDSPKSSKLSVWVAVAAMP